MKHTIRILAMHRNRLARSILILFFSIPALASMNDPLQQVVDLHTNATGGKESIEKIQSLEYSLQIQEPTFTVDAIYKTDRNLRMRIDIYADGQRVFTEAFDGKEGWQMGEDGQPKETSPKGTAALRNGIFLGKMIGLHELTSFGHKLEYHGKQELDAISYHVLKLTLDSGAVTYLYIHPQTGFIERTRANKALHVDVDPTKIPTESRTSDFRAVNGVQRAFKSVETDLKTGKVMQIVTVKDMKANVKFDDALFRKPEDEEANR